MSEKEAREVAETKVYVYMNRGDIEEECLNKGIKISKDRSKMESKLIEAYIKEWSQ